MLPNPTLQRYIRPAPFVVTHVKPSEGDVAGLSDVKPSSGRRGARAQGNAQRGLTTPQRRTFHEDTARCLLFVKENILKREKKQLSRSRNSAREVRFAAENRSEGREGVKIS